MICRHIKLREDIVKDEVDYYMDSFEDICEAIKNRPSNSLGSEFKESLKILSLLTIGSRDKSEVLHILRFAKNIGLMNFQFGSKAGESFTCSIVGRDSFTLVGQETTVYMDTDTWLNALFVSLLLRDMNAVDTLCQVPESIHTKANIKPDPFDLAFVRVMKGLFKPDVNIGKLLLEAMQTSESDLIHADRREYINYILFPQLPLYRCIMSGTPSEFNDQLQEAVLSHKEYWSEGDRKYNSEGWISLPLIAAAVLAFDDKNYELTFETEYIPNWLVREEF